MNLKYNAYILFGKFKVVASKTFKALVLIQILHFCLSSIQNKIILHLIM